MAQESRPNVREPKRLIGSNIDVAIAQASTTLLFECNVAGVEKISCVIVNAGFALDAFTVEGRNHQNGPWITFASTAGNFTTPAGRITAASGDFTTLGVATGYFDMDVTTLNDVRVKASSVNAAGSTTSIYVSGGAASGAGSSSTTVSGGTVGIDQVTAGASKVVASTPYSSQITVTRAANQTPYAANDVVGGAITFTSIGPAAGYIDILDADLRIDVTAIPSGMSTFRLHLYSATPPSALTDNDPWDLPSGDRSVYLGYVDMGSIADLGSTLFAQTTGTGRKRVLLGATTSLFAYLVTAGAFTPAGNSEVYTPRLQARGV